MKTVIARSSRMGDQEVIVDDDDFDRVNRWKWQLSNNGYASRTHWNGDCYEKMYMHRLIAGTPPGMDTDHINRNKLDNRKSNLRVVDRSRNNHNSAPSKANTSGHKGVAWFKPAGLWRAYIKHSSSPTRIELGYFHTKEEAVAARQRAEQEFGL